MKRQENLLMIKCAVLSLMLALTLASGYVFAQTQYAYTANYDTSTVSQIQTSTDTVLGQPIQLTQATNPRSLALSSDDSILVVTLNAANYPAGDPSIARIDLPFPGITRYIRTDKRAEFVAITPPITSGATTCSYAYISTNPFNTADQPYVSVVNLCNNNPSAIALPQGGGMDPIGSFGVTAPTIPNGNVEVWVTDPNFGNRRDRPFVYVIDPVKGTVENPITLACSPTCQMTPGCCPFVDQAHQPSPRHIAYAYISPTEYRMYVADSTPQNKVVWTIKNTINLNGTITRQVLDPGIRFNSGICDISANYSTFAISVNSNVTYPNPPTTAYVTAPGIDNRLYTIDIANNRGACVPTLIQGYPPGTFFAARGVAWLANGRAYVGNDSVLKVTTIQQDSNALPGMVATPGQPYWVTITNGVYSGSGLGPTRSTRIR